MVPALSLKVREEPAGLPAESVNGFVTVTTWPAIVQPAAAFVTPERDERGAQVPSTVPTSAGRVILIWLSWTRVVSSVREKVQVVVENTSVLSAEIAMLEREPLVGV